MGLSSISSGLRLLRDGLFFVVAFAVCSGPILSIVPAVIGMSERSVSILIV
jgi:hypothetical protein